MTNAFIEIPNVLTTANYALTSYYGQTITENLSGEYDLSRSPTVISGHWGSDYGDNSFSCDPTMWNNGVDGLEFMTRGQAYCPQRFNDAFYWFVAVKNSTEYEDNGSLEIYISNQPWPTDKDNKKGNYIKKTVTLGNFSNIADTTNSRITGTITDLPRPIDGMLYIYILSDNARVAGFGINIQGWS